MTIPRIDGLDRNYLMNGAFDYFQRGVDILTVAGVPSYYAPDRWFINTANQAFTVKRSTDVPALSKSKYSLEYNTVSPIGGIDRVMWTDQKIESIFARELSNKPISLRFNYKSPSANQIRVWIRKATLEDNFAGLTTIYDQTFSISNDSSWNEFKLEDIALGDVSTGLMISVAYQNTVNLVSGSHLLNDIKLNIGTKAQEFSLAGRDTTEELLLCQRYFEKSYDADDAVGSITGLSQYNMMVNVNGFVQQTFLFKSPKRTAPIATFYSPVTGNAGFIYRSTAGDIAQITSNIGLNSFALDRTSGIANNRKVVAHYTADAEL